MRLKQGWSQSTVMTHKKMCALTNRVLIPQKLHWFLEGSSRWWCDGPIFFNCCHYVCCSMACASFCPSAALSVEWSRETDWSAWLRVYSVWRVQNTHNCIPAGGSHTQTSPTALCVCMSVCVWVRACVRACVLACMRAWVRAWVHMCVCEREREQVR